MAKKEQLIPVPGPKLLEAIGEVTVKWSALETMLDQMLYWASDPQDQSIPRLLSGGAIAVRWSKLKEIVIQEHRGHPGNPELIAIIDSALSIKGERDKIVHGLFADRENELSPEAVVAVMLTKKGFKDWSLNRPRILETAKKIDEIAHCLFNLQLDFGERTGNFIRANAWRHRDRKDD